MAQKTSTPFSSQVIVIIVLSLEDLDEVFQFSLVFFGDFSDSNASSGLLTDNFTESCLALDETEGDTLLSAELREPNDSFNRVNVVGDSNESSFLFFDQFSNFIKTEFDGKGSLSGGFLVGSFILSTLEQSLSSVLLAFGSDLLEEIHKGGSLISSDGLRELVEGRGDLQSLQKDLLLSLKDDVFWPSDISGEISLRSDVTSDSEVSGSLFKKRILLDLGGLGRLGWLLEFSFSHDFGFSGCIYI